MLPPAPWTRVIVQAARAGMGPDSGQDATSRVCDAASNRANWGLSSVSAAPAAARMRGTSAWGTSVFGPPPS